MAYGILVFVLMQKCITLRIAKMQVVPEGFRRFLVWIKQSYGDVEIIVTENGYSDEENLDDQDRINYFRVCFNLCSV